MRFTKPFCPKCGELADGTMETVPAYSRLEWAEAPLPEPTCQDLAVQHRTRSIVLDGNAPRVQQSNLMPSGDYDDYPPF